MNKGFIYLFIVNNKGYVGKAFNLRKRFKSHFREKIRNLHFHNSLRKHFKENGSFKIIECWKRNGRTLEEFKKLLNSREIFWTEKLGTFDPEQKKGWNLTKGGGGPLGYIPSEKTKRRLSKAGKGKIKTEEHKKKISESRKGEKNPRWGKKSPWLSELNKKRKGISRPKEVREKISKGNKGKPKQKEHIRKIQETKRIKRRIKNEKNN